MISIIDIVICIVCFFPFYWVCIFFHESAHYVVAKWLRFEVMEFVVGKGKKLVSFRFKSTSYNFNLIPTEGRIEVSARAFIKRPLASSLVIICGPLANLLFCVASIIVYKASGFVALYLLAIVNSYFFILSLWGGDGGLFLKAIHVYCRKKQKKLMSLGILVLLHKSKYKYHKN
ncbi:site-2 protease family protein [Brevibacillus reuszeri]|uniref:site-2 protease family protein n=1 Tax=Brevibacillus reuszeri TaxID=54915 RepID=UPI000CCBD73B|nr:site-2 protease family protein [Brevibacillus reuszeri]